MAVQGNELVIDDSNAYMFQGGTVINGEMKSTGLLPRDFNKHPVGLHAGLTGWTLSDLTPINRSEWPERIKDMEATESRLSDVRARGANGGLIPSLDQNGAGFCWMYDPVMALMIVRAAMGEPYVRLSPHACACKIKNFQDEGGWGAQGVEFLIDKGCPSEKYWPQKSMSSQYDTAETWKDALNYRFTEGWMDMSEAAWDRNLVFDLVMTCLMLRVPVVADYYWWGHSIVAIDPVEVDSSLDLQDPNRWGSRNLNSWSDSFGEKGLCVLKGSKAVPNGACAPRVAIAV